MTIFRWFFGRIEAEKNCFCDFLTFQDPQLFACVNNFLASESSCEIPWLKNYSPPGLKKCTNKEIRQYFDLANKISIGYGYEIDKLFTGSDNKFRLSNLWFSFTNLYHFLLFCTWNLSFSLSALFQTWEKKIKFWCKYQFQLGNVKNQAQIDNGCLLMAKTIW